MRVALAATLVLAAACCAAPASPNSLPADDKEAAGAGAAPSTHALLSRLGLRRLRVPAAHHRKRLAEQGRRRAAADSRMFLIKLPPSAGYYAHAAPATPATATAAARTLPLALRSNGKPARVYHWNLPELRRLAAGEAAGAAEARPQARLDDAAGAAGRRRHPNAVDAPPPAYYVPAERKPSFRKYFSGNGKPESFYLMSKSKKPAHYHRLLP